MKLILVMLILVAGCEFDYPTGTVSGKANFIIMSRTSGRTVYNAPVMNIRVKNIGSGTGYNVSCSVKAKKGNLIVDSGFAYFADGGNINPREQAQDEAIFFKLTTLNNYKLEYDLSWLER